MSQQRGRKAKEIDLMQLLAFSATDDSLKLIKEHGFPDAANHFDLQRKLEQIWYKAPDKKAYEKELASIHPHKKWLFNTLKPEIETPSTPIQISTQVPKQEIVKTEVVSPAEGSTDCIGCRFSSNAEGNNAPIQKQLDHKQTDTFHIIALVAVVGLILYAFKHH